MSTECKNIRDQKCRSRLYPSYCDDCYEDMVEQRNHWRYEAKKAMRLANELDGQLNRAVGAAGDRDDWKLASEQWAKKAAETDRELQRERAAHEDTRTQLDRIMHAHMIAGFCTEEMLCACACKQCVHIARSMEDGGYLEPGAAGRVEAAYEEHIRSLEVGLEASRDEASAVAREWSVVDGDGLEGDYDGTEEFPEQAPPDLAADIASGKDPYDEGP